MGSAVPNSMARRTRAQRAAEIYLRSLETENEVVASPSSMANPSWPQQVSYVPVRRGNRPGTLSERFDGMANTDADESEDHPGAPPCTCSSFWSWPWCSSLCKSCFGVVETDQQQNLRWKKYVEIFIVLLLLGVGYNMIYPSEPDPNPELEPEPTD
jgi:hypothetical protein